MTPLRGVPFQIITGINSSQSMISRMELLKIGEFIDGLNDEYWLRELVSYI